MQLHALPKETVMRNPAKGMETRSIKSEIRTDPLTGRTARICHFMALKWEQPDFEALVAGTDKMCPFCGQRVMQITPCFPEEIVPDGRMVSEDMVLFPNIAPYDALGAVATISARHYIPMTDFAPQRIAGAFGLAFDYFQRLEALEHPESVYHLINWNYMPPAGSSLIHPHLQVFATSSPPNLLAQELAASRAYTEKNGNELLGRFRSSRKKRRRALPGPHRPHRVDDRLGPHGRCRRRAGRGRRDGLHPRSDRPGLARHRHRPHAPDEGLRPHGHLQL